MSCAKCHQCPASDPDTWCLGCSCWEALGWELTSRWHSPGLRELANSQIISAVKAVRALRSVSTGLQSAGDSRAAKASGSQEKAAAPAERAPLPRPREGDHPKRPEPVKEQEASSGDSQEDSEESSGRPGTAPKSNPALRPPEPELPPLPRRPESSAKRSLPEEELAAPEVKKKKKKNKDKRDRRGNRAGRKHPRLYRAVDNPNARLHRRLPANYWDTPDRIGDLGDHRRDRRDGR